MQSVQIPLSARVRRSPSPASTLTLPRLEALAEEFEVPLTDVLCLALNLHGLASRHENARIRYQLVPLDEDPARPFLVITPTWVPDSPFAIRDRHLYLGDERVGTIPLAENDDVVLSYLRQDGRLLNLNSNSRSTCTGCMFCPNVIEDPADARLKTAEDLDRFVRWVMADYGWTDLRHLEKITISSGCFQTDRAAIEHLAALRQVAEGYGFGGVYHILSSVIRRPEALRECVERLGRFHLTVTFECTTRRSLLLKDTKADLHLDACLRVLDDAMEAGATADITYIAGLDPYEVSRETLRRVAGHVNGFPKIQIYQVHNALMRGHRAPGAEKLEWFLHLRRDVEPWLAAAGVRPVLYENYRAMWFTAFAGAPIVGPRI